MAYQTTNPATGATVAAFEEISDLELAKVIDVAQACYERDWRNRPIAQRAQIVRAAAKLMRERQEHLAGLVTLEMGQADR